MIIAHPHVLNFVRTLTFHCCSVGLLLPTATLCMQVDSWSGATRQYKQTSPPLPSLLLLIDKRYLSLGSMAGFRCVLRDTEWFRCRCGGVNGSRRNARYFYWQYVSPSSCCLLLSPDILCPKPPFRTKGYHSPGLVGAVPVWRLCPCRFVVLLQFL